MSRSPNMSNPTAQMVSGQPVGRRKRKYNLGGGGAKEPLATTPSPAQPPELAALFWPDHCHDSMLRKDEKRLHNRQVREAFQSGKDSTQVRDGYYSSARIKKP